MQFLVESAFKQAPTPEVLALLPAESERGRMLDDMGVRRALYVAADQSKAWQLFKADSLAALQEIVASFPLYPHLHTTITQLATV
ncbi:MAG: hypothetical protein DYG89_08120 [Caldilinea sp. CFX5]|nr:hypothetical protein [Caldilinea sp. CFX5]